VTVAVQRSSLLSGLLPIWRRNWGDLSYSRRAVMGFLLAGAAVGTMLLGSGLLKEGAAQLLSAFVFAWLPLGAGVLLILGSTQLPGQARWAWTTIGGGTLCWAAGELVWQYYSVIAQTDVPYPGIADVFYVLGYPVMFAGVLLLPHVAARRWEKARLTLDAIAGTVAIGAVAWTTYLHDLVAIDPEAGRLEQVINLAYPLGDVILLVAVMILTVRRSPYQFDGRLVAFGLAMAATAVADVVYVFQVEAGTYRDGGPLDAIWTAGYGLLAACAFFLFGPMHLREQADQPQRFWPLVAPYSAIAVLFALTMGELGGQATVLQAATAIVGVTIILRQGVAIRETREVVERQRNDLVASISHELRTPLTAMSGFMEILAEEPDLDVAERDEMIAIVNTQTQHLTRIVGDLVEVARDKLQAVRLKPVLLPVDGVAASAVDLVAKSESAVAVTIEVEPGLTVVADPDRLHQVLVNFLTNAFRYGRGQVHLVARTERSSVVIEVHDNGPGVPKKYELTVWDRFQRGSHTFLSEVQGSGLGLAIARQLITAHGGHTGYRRSETLGGACFWLSIPTD
jgi:signal transduction histidine kinase